jgi:iron complex outermembrane receptor protein
MSQTQFENFAGTFFPYVPGGLFARLSLADIYQDQFSQELQVIGTAQSLKYVVGGYYYTESGRDSAYTPSGARFNTDGSGYVNLATPVGSPPPARASKASTESFGLFANLTYTPAVLEDRLHLTGGLRYSNEHKDGALTFRRGVPLTGITFDFKSERVDPKFDIAFDWNPDVMTYLSWGRGFRSGGANSRSPRFLKFGEETGSTWELGLKSQFLDDRARFNVALWASRYENIQIEFTDPTNPSVLETANANKVAHFKGIEAEFTLVPVPGLTLSSSFAYTDAKIPPQPSPFGGTEIVNVPVVNTPKYAGAISMKWDVVETDWADIKFQADATFSSKFFASLASPRATDGYTLLNMRLGFDNIPLLGRNEGTSISFWAKNITNAQYISGDFTPIAGPGLSNFMISYYNEPRTYGVELTHRF